MKKVCWKNAVMGKSPIDSVCNVSEINNESEQSRF